MKPFLIGLFLLIGISSLESHTGEEYINEACKKYRVKDCNLVKAVAFIESRMDVGISRNPTLEINGTLSYGLLQVSCRAARDVGLKGKCSQLRKIRVSLKYGIIYLYLKFRKYNGDLTKTISSYNVGRYIECKRFNIKRGRILCYPGQSINALYVWRVMNHYKYLEGK